MNRSDPQLGFNVAQLLKDPVGSTRKFTLHAGALPLHASDLQAEAGGVLEARNVTGQVKVTRMSRDLLVQGDVQAEVRLACSRCLDEYSLPVDGTLEEQFQSTVDVKTGRPVVRSEHEKDDSAFPIDENHVMDLTEPIRQALLVALPLKPLCREDCAGLCPVCGKNLNRGECDHQDETIDNRWSALRELSLEDLPAGEGNSN